MDANCMFAWMELEIEYSATWSEGKEMIQNASI